MVFSYLVRGVLIFIMWKQIEELFGKMNYKTQNITFHFLLMKLENNIFIFYWIIEKQTVKQRLLISLLKKNMYLFIHSFFFSIDSCSLE